MRPPPIRRLVVLAMALCALGALLVACGHPTRPGLVTEPAARVDPLIGTAGGGNTFPGAVIPFGMVAWSPETTRGDPTRRRPAATVTMRPEYADSA